MGFLPFPDDASRLRSVHEIAVLKALAIKHSVIELVVTRTTGWTLAKAGLPWGLVAQIRTRILISRKLLATNKISKRVCLVSPGSFNSAWPMHRNQIRLSRRASDVSSPRGLWNHALFFRNRQAITATAADRKVGSREPKALLLGT